MQGLRSELHKCSQRFNTSGMNTFQMRYILSYQKGYYHITSFVRYLTFENKIKEVKTPNVSLRFETVLVKFKAALRAS